MDIPPIFTPDVAVIRIQRKWRAILIKEYWKALLRAAYEEVWDPVRGKYNYIHREFTNVLTEKPFLLRNELWNPKRVPDWSMDQVSLFLRRIQLKQYVDVMKTYGVDGNTLYLLDDEDFDNMQITNRLHRKRIVVEVRKLYRSVKPVVRNADNALRREKIRRRKLFDAAATRIQKVVRGFFARKELGLRREVRRIQTEERRRRQQIQASNIWWTDHPQLPSKKLAAFPLVNNKGMKLPPLKTFGRRKDYLSFRGWGRKGAGLSSEWIPAPPAIVDKNFMGDASTTLFISEKLYISGYNEKRWQRFGETMMS